MICQTQCTKGAIFTLRFPIGYAYCCPQFHQRLIHVSSNLSCQCVIDFFFPCLFGLLEHDIPFIGKDSGHHAKHIAVHCRKRQRKRNGSYRTSRIRSNAFQPQKCFMVCRHFSVVFCHDLFCRCLHVPHTAIIS